MRSEDLQCDVRNLSYDFNTCVGRLFVAEGAECEVSACVQMFERIDRSVRRIVVIADQKVVAMQERDSFGGWKPFALDDV